MKGELYIGESGRQKGNVYSQGTGCIYFTAESKWAIIVSKPSGRRRVIDDGKLELKGVYRDRLKVKDDEIIQLKHEIEQLKTKLQNYELLR